MSKFTFWCPICKYKRVVGLNVAALHNKYCEDGKRFICYNCEETFTIIELEAYGNNVNRVVRQQRMNQSDYSPRMPVGENTW